jgi:hypothetical protein
LPLLDIEVLGPTTPGVSQVRLTAATELVLDTTREVLVMFVAGMANVRL